MGNLKIDEVPVTTKTFLYTAKAIDLNLKLP